MRSVVGGRELDLTADDVVRSMRGVEPDPIREHFVVIGDKMFPPKQVLAQATGWDRRTFTTMEATRVLSRLGLVCQRAGRRVDGRPAWVPEGKTGLEDHGPVTIEQRLSAVGVGVRTVGDLIERLSNFDPTAPVRLQTERPLSHCRNPALTSSCDSRRIGTGRMFQMCSQYSRMVRSEEKAPERAAFRIDLCAQVS